jgi:hypothetical protein
MKPAKSNVERLEDEGVLDPTTLSAKQKADVNRLSDDEVKHLISARKTVGDYSEGAHPGGRPWIL